MGQMGQEEKRGEVVAEYLNGGVSVRELERKHGTSRSTIHRWVKESERLKGPEEAGKEKERRALVVKDTEQTADVRRLRKELEEARLYNKLLNAMIDIAEDQMGVDIRKKHGAKRR
jgi:transposase-like protein